MFKKSFLLLLLIVPAFLGAQSAADEIETMLSTDAVTYAQAASFTLRAAGVFAANDAQEAFNFALQQGWLPGNVSPGAPARLDHLSLLFMRSFDMRGGIMFSIFGNAHYAFRELIYLNVIQRRAVPSMHVSGDRLLFFVSRLLGMNSAVDAADESVSMQRDVSEAAGRDAAAYEALVRETAAREAAARDAATREALARETAEREAAAREALARETAAREAAARETAEREAAAREAAARDAAARDAAARETAARETAAREAAARDAAARETLARETAAREAAARDAAARETAERDTAAREALAREAAARDAAARETYAYTRDELIAEIAYAIEEQDIADDTYVAGTTEGVMITFSNILFEADSIVLPDGEKPKIYEIARVISTIPNVRLYISGHSTHLGSDEYLRWLSAGRAQSVADYLISLRAVEAANVIVAGYGPGRPAARLTQEELAANRRVEITILEY